ncbi:MAG: DinB family protein [Bacteroidota bacterium]|nr:DinB family protein [Bacteroidota bacterium]
MPHATKRPEASEYPAYYKGYVDLVRKDNIIKVLGDQVLEIQAIISQIPEEKEDYAYAEGKWTIKEIIGHIIDTERILGYRAMRFARKDKTPLPGYDENHYVANANFKNQTLYQLAHEFAVVREANLALFKVWKEEELSQVGVANDLDVSVRALLFMMAGHATHHVNVIKSRYLVD